MLARVAENMYWMSRYVERAENMARLVNVNSNLLLDLPRGIAPGWRPLVTIVGADEVFAEKYGDADDEARVIRFLIADRDNPQSILSLVTRARENARTFRDATPQEAWEEVNALYHYVRDNVQSGLTKRGRFDYLASVIRRSQTLTGLLSGCMNHDDSYSYVHLGRHVERAVHQVEISHAARVGKKIRRALDEELLEVELYAEEFGVLELAVVRDVVVHFLALVIVQVDAEVLDRLR